MTRRYFGTDGIRGLANKHPMTSEIALKVGMAAGKLFQNGFSSPSRRDRQGYAPVGLHARSGVDVSASPPVGMDVFLLGPMPTPAVAMLTRSPARRSRRDDLRLAQSLRRQRHQAVRSRRLQAPWTRWSHEIEALIDADRATRFSLRPAEHRPCHSGRQRSGTLHRIRQADAACASAGVCASSSIAPTVPAYKVAPKRFGNSAPRSSRSASSRTACNINLKCGSTAPDALVEKVANCAPISVSPRR